MADHLKTVHVDGKVREASGLLAASPSLLSARGWDAGFWTVVDEGPVDKAVHLIARRDGDWTLERPNFTSVARKTADGEALARHGEHVYIFGSHFGADGKPEAKRAFAARFREHDVLAGDGADVTLALWHDEFDLHRAVNDILLGSGIALMPMRDEINEIMAQDGARFRRGDAPLNVEGIAFRPDGSLFVGLRCPVTASGHPIVVELVGYAQSFGGPLPQVSAVWELSDVTAERGAVGIRDLEAEVDGGAEPNGVTLSLIAGGLDKEVFRKAQRGDAGFAHWRATLPPPGGEPGRARAHRVREFPDDIERVEGVAHDPAGTDVYLCDDEHGVVLLVAG